MSFRSCSGQHPLEAASQHNTQKWHEAKIRSSFFGRRRKPAENEIEDGFRVTISLMFNTYRLGSQRLRTKTFGRKLLRAKTIGGRNHLRVKMVSSSFFGLRPTLTPYTATKKTDNYSAFFPILSLSPSLCTTKTKNNSDFRIVGPWLMSYLRQFCVSEFSAWQEITILYEDSSRNHRALLLQSFWSNLWIAGITFACSYGHSIDAITMSQFIRGSKQWHGYHHIAVTRSHS